MQRGIVWWACVILACGVAARVAAAESEGRPNVLFIAIDDLRNDLGYLGVGHAQTPHLDALAATSRLFSHHYVQVPTCGASRCALLRGKYPDKPVYVSNAAIARSHADWALRGMPHWFRQHGYRTFALGKITHHPGGLTGANWATGPEELPGAWSRAWIPDGPWKTPEAIMHGYANGGARNRGKSPPWEAHDGPDESYPDAWIASEAIAHLEQLAASDKPWFFGVGFFKPHLPFAAPRSWYDRHDPAKLAEPVSGVPAISRPGDPRGYHQSGELRGNYGHPSGRDPVTDADYARQLRHGYAASISYMDAQLGRLMAAFDRLRLSDTTVVVVWSDHGFLLGEHGVWCKHCLFEQAVRSPLMIRYPGLPEAGRISSAVVETVDIFPTLVELCQLPLPEGLDGRSLLPQLHNAEKPTSKPAQSFYTAGKQALRTAEWRLIVHPGAAGDTADVELYNMQDDPHETRNVAAEHAEVVRQLRGQMATWAAN